MSQMQPNSIEKGVRLELGVKKGAKGQYPRFVFCKKKKHNRFEMVLFVFFFFFSGKKKTPQADDATVPQVRFSDDAGNESPVACEMVIPDRKRKPRIVKSVKYPRTARRQSVRKIAQKGESDLRRRLRVATEGFLNEILTAIGQKFGVIQ